MRLAFEAAIRPLNLSLAKSLGVRNIKVRHYSYDHPVTVQVKEDGIVTSCNHAGAKMTIVEDQYLHGNIFTGNVEMREQSFTGILCDKCPAWSIDGEEWYE